ncbi:MAG: hypothetical protein Kow0077_18230 [Anaerolineae bacterium]
MTRPKTSLFVLMVVAALLAAALPALAQTGGDAELTFVPFVSREMGFESIVPDGWTQAAPGTFRRLNTADDLVMVVEQAAIGFGAEDVSLALLQQLGLDSMPDPTTTVETDALSWEVYRLEVEPPQIGTVVLYLALARNEYPVITHLVLAQGTAEEATFLYESLLLPVVEAFTPFSVNWGQADGPTPPPEDFEAVRLRPEVLDTRPHDPTSFTQGLLYYDGSLYESDGNCCPSYSTYSTLREVDPATGEVLRSIDLDPQYFAEGLERVGDQLIQLTWQENTAFVYDIETFEQVSTFSYEGEGWGLCTDGDLLYMSDGTPFITLRDPETFEVVDTGLVTFQGLPVENINELECVGDLIYANIWQTDVIVQIDKSNGEVVGVVDASDLLSDEDKATITPGSDVLNGIVYLPESDTFLITGKHWPRMFEVRFVAIEE